MTFMNISNLHHLKYFIDAAKEGSVSLAARKNYVTQSAVSRAIANLEEALQVELVVHRQNHFQLTEAGEAVVAKSSSVFESIANLQATAFDHVKTLHGPLRFGCNQAIASKLIAPALVAIEKEYPGIRPQLTIGNTDQIQYQIEAREIDFGIVVDDGEVGAWYRTQKIYRGALLVVKSPSLKNSGYAENPLQNLIISRTQKGGLSHLFFAEYEKQYGAAITPKMIVPNWQVTMDLAIAGYGAALVPEFLCMDAIRAKKLESVKHRMKIAPFHLCTITSKDRALPKNAKALLDYFKS
jgi:DNA-binding transcriptional LysR family regulator